ncbi:MAG TPA: hypothetical protein VGM90_35140 [Kofleriaceae bacterium]
MSGGALVKREVLKPTIVSRIALAVAAALPIGFSIAGSAWIATAAFSATVVAIGTGLARRSITVDDNGVTRQSLLGTATIAWDDVDYYTYWSGNPRRNFFKDEANPDLGRSINGPFSDVTTTRHNLVIHARDKRRIAITTGFRRAGDAVAIALAEIHQRHADRTKFAPFTIEDEGLAHERAGFIPWVDIEIVRLWEYPAVIQIMKDGKSFPWATASLAKAHDGCLFLEKIAARGIPVDLGGRQLVTTTLIETLTRNSALPVAKVVKRKPQKAKTELPQARVIKR